MKTWLVIGLKRDGRSESIPLLGSSQDASGSSPLSGASAGQTEWPVAAFGEQAFKAHKAGSSE